MKESSSNYEIENEKSDKAGDLEEDTNDYGQLEKFYNTF